LRSASSLRRLAVAVVVGVAVACGSTPPVEDGTGPGADAVEVGVDDGTPEPAGRGGR
jgi:hypothetical protein